jgi:hypothetical protein
MFLTDLPEERRRSGQWPSWRAMLVFVFAKGWRILRWSALALAVLAYMNESMQLIRTPLPISPVIVVLLAFSFGIPLYQWFSAKRRFKDHSQLQAGTVPSAPPDAQKIAP